MHHATLPASLREELGGALDQAHAGVGDDQLDTLQAALLEVAQKSAPTGLVLLGALDNAENLAIALAIDRDRHQQRDVADFASPAALEHDARRGSPCVASDDGLLK
jgi:hypothetical protein